MDAIHYDAEASRMEYCCIRFIYIIPVMIIGGIVSAIYSIFLLILNFVNFFTILFGGSRFEPFFNIFDKLMTWQIKVSFYMAGATDERPPLIP